MFVLLFLFSHSDFSLVNTTLGESNIECSSTVCLFKYPCSSSTICTPYKVELYPGEYILEVWGAEGGNLGSISGKGGYSIGGYSIRNNQIVYLYIGGKGQTRGEGGNMCISGGYNGGGLSCSERFHTSGGGGTDVRLSLNNAYNDRIIVAGGGGGSSGTTSYTISNGGCGGGLQGGNAIGSAPRVSLGYGSVWANGGTQTNGGGSKILSATYVNSNGEWGIGGKGAGGYHYSGSGGGGFYGGGGGADVTAGGGGSGFISGLSVINGIQPQSISGCNTFPSPNGGTENGHTGNGAIRITVIKNYSLRKKEGISGLFILLVHMISII